GREELARALRSGRAAAHRDRLAQGPLQPRLRLHHRGDAAALGCRPAGLRAQADAGRRRALRHPGAQGLRGQGARGRGAAAGPRERALRRAARGGGRPPVVEALAQDPFVPNDTTLAADGPQVLILTGPNMGGKSTYLRQVALIVLLAQMGSFVPATEAEVGLVDRLFTRVGASDNLAAGESTFMVEMRETATILANLTPRSLVVLDEIGRGTSTFDGISIAWAVAEHLHDAPERPRTLFATHYHELTALAATHPRVANLSVAVTEWRGDIVFLRQIVPGPASRSYGVEVARLAGVPAPVVARARALLARLEAGHSPGSEPAEETAGAQLTLFPDPAERVRRELAALEPERLTPL